MENSFCFLGRAAGGKLFHFETLAPTVYVITKGAIRFYFARRKSQNDQRPSNG
jgi:hypothetical protein